MAIYKAVVLTVAALPISGNDVGDKRLVLFDKVVYEWNGSAWVSEQSIVDQVKKFFWVGEPS